MSSCGAASDCGENNDEHIDSASLAPRTVTFRVEGRRIVVARSALLQRSAYLRHFFADTTRCALPEIEVRRARYTAVKAALYICAYNDDTLFSRLESTCDQLHSKLYSNKGAASRAHPTIRKKYRSCMRVLISFFETCLCFELHVYTCIAAELIVQTHINRDTVRMIWRVCERHSSNSGPVSRCNASLSGAETEQNSVSTLNLPLIYLRRHCLQYRQDNNSKTNSSEFDDKTVTAVMMLTRTIMSLRRKHDEARKRNRTLLSHIFDTRVDHVTDYALRTAHGVRALELKAAALKRNIQSYCQREKIEWHHYYQELYYAEHVQAYLTGLVRTNKSMQTALRLLRQSHQYSKGDPEALKYTLSCLIDREANLCALVDTDANNDTQVQHNNDVYTHK